MRGLPRLRCRRRPDPGPRAVDRPPGAGHRDPVPALDRGLHRQYRPDAGQGRQPRPVGRADGSHGRLDGRQPAMTRPRAAVAMTPPPGGVFVSAPEEPRMPLSHLPLSLVLAALMAGCGTPAVEAPGAAPVRAEGVLAIGQVQGDGAASPLLDRSVTVEGVVTGNFGRHLGGWFVQDAGDGDAATSDAIFVVAGEDPGLRAGDKVRVHGRVVEHGERGRGTLTSLQPASIDVVGRSTVAPLVLDGPPGDWEPLEGMQVRIDAPLTIDGQHELSRRGVLHASFGDRVYSPTELAPPGPQAARVAADNARRRLLLDDARAQERPSRVWYLEGGPAPRSGSVVSGVEGIVDQRWGDWRLQLTTVPRIEPAARPPAPTVPGSVRLASFNLGNLFNGDGRGGGFPTSRGARTAAQWQAQLARAVATLQALDPHVVALMALENDGYGPDAALAQLVDALNADGGDWAFVDAGQGPGGDAIRVGIVYRSGRLRPLGRPAMLEDGPLGRGSRVPLAQAFVPVAQGRDA